ncbi:hypothetical protein AZE42_12633 [Rhizopogon vesiculosus]|uniref:Carboxypeptidase n=1 Tax=Rhizopogon vesiculosus TaxID=180088 RepID=A0A1J8QYH1_9AGAM|nr:hypothetical protein AZE42_12633 [Rhizopogon vesiculosus]
MSASGRYRAPHVQGRSSKGLFLAEMGQSYNAHLAKRSTSPSSRERVRAADAWKRDLAGRANGTIDPWYGCDVYDEMLDYAINFTFPWSLSKQSGGMFDVYDIPDALNPEAPSDASVFLNDPRTRSALHVPSQDWQGSIDYPFGNNYSNSDPSVEPMAFLTDLATNATAKNVSVVVFSGNDDSLLPHLVAIQNTTFGGIQGFTRKPSTPWYDDDGEFAGIVHQERNWTYVLVDHAGHLSQ